MLFLIPILVLVGRTSKFVRRLAACVPRLLINRPEECSGWFAGQSARTRRRARLGLVLSKVWVFAPVTKSPRPPDDKQIDDCVWWLVVVSVLQAG